MSALAMSTRRYTTRRDGANLFQRIWHINLPGIASVVAIVFIVRLGQLFSGI